MAATQSTSGHDSSNGSNMPYHALPASPTLTNPDMILPDYDYDHSSSPVRDRIPSPAWKNDSSDQQFSLISQGFIAGPVTPTTPIIYGNGTMLSDIGEVTEVESTVGKAQSLRNRRLSDDSTEGDGLPLKSTPNRGARAPYERVKERTREFNVERRASIDSASTFTTHDRNTVFADFDDSVSVDDSNFQGDDEESLTSSYHQEDGLKAPSEALRNRLRNATLTLEDRSSTALLSKRAEEILANAKRRSSVSLASTSVVSLLPVPCSLILPNVADYGGEPLESKGYELHRIANPSKWILHRLVHSFPANCQALDLGGERHATVHNSRSWTRPYDESGQYVLDHRN